VQVTCSSPVGALVRPFSLPNGTHEAVHLSPRLRCHRCELRALCGGDAGSIVPFVVLGETPHGVAQGLRIIRDGGGMCDGDRSEKEGARERQDGGDPRGLHDGPTQHVRKMFPS